MNSLKDEELKQIKEILNDDFEQNDKEVINYISFEEQFNYLLNPHHPDFTTIKIISQEDFPFDKRIFK